MTSIKALYDPVLGYNNGTIPYDTFPTQAAVDAEYAGLGWSTILTTLTTTQPNTETRKLWLNG